ncbi:MAG: CRISPR-associated protein Csx16 [Sulfuritalea sp.]|nr:CRISPR-associated protein Csx16 [Sulfuritalea sp.]
MTVWFVSRHPGAVDWARRRDLGIDVWLVHLDATRVGAGDTVIGSLPLHLAAEVCSRGARFLHLTLGIPAEWRGRELSADELEAAGTRLEQFFVKGIA